MPRSAEINAKIYNGVYFERHYLEDGRIKVQHLRRILNLKRLHLFFSPARERSRRFSSTSLTETARKWIYEYNSLGIYMDFIDVYTYQRVTKNITISFDRTIIK